MYYVYDKPLYITLYDTMTHLKGSCPLGPTEERGSKDPVLQLRIENFYNMVLTSLKGQSPRTPTFPHFLHNFPPTGVWDVYLD